MKSRHIQQTISLLIIIMLGATCADMTARAENAPGVAYRTVTIDNVEIFYREAGDPNRPTILLLHGFPTSSHMFRDLITELADEYHLLDTGHFALETHGQEIADLMRDFLSRKIQSPMAAN
jgi:hypothetical protein